MNETAHAHPDNLLDRAEEEARRAGLRIVRADAGLALTDGTLEIRGDYSHMTTRVKPQNLNRELLVRAAKLKGADVPRTTIDATAGLGEDALLLAAAGFDVRLYERNPVIAALLQDAIGRAREIPELADAASRMTLEFGDSVEALLNLKARPGIVFLDPMFPSRRKSAAVKKKLALLQQLEEPCDDEQELLAAALSARPRKVVVKRPVKGPYLAGKKPDYSLGGKAVRYDCYTLPL